MDKMQRREFLKTSVAGMAGVLAGAKIASAQTCCPGGSTVAATELAGSGKAFDPYEMVQLGKTDIKLSRLGFGTGMTGGNRASNQTRLGRERFQALLRESYDRGLRYFDSADMYGSHSYIIPALKGIDRDKYAICSKIQRFDILEGEKEKPLVTFDRFQKELQTDYIDLLLFHCVWEGDWNKLYKPYMDGMSELKEKGKVHALGVSCHSLDALRTAVKEPWVDSVHARINAFGSEMDGSPEDVMAVLKEIHDAGKGVVGMKLIGAGAFRNSPEQKIKSADFVLNSGNVDAVIVGFESTEELADYESIVRKTPVRTA